MSALGDRRPGLRPVRHPRPGVRPALVPAGTPHRRPAARGRRLPGLRRAPPSTSARRSRTAPAPPASAPAGRRDHRPGGPPRPARGGRRLRARDGRAAGSTRPGHWPASCAPTSAAGKPTPPARAAAPDRSGCAARPPTINARTGEVVESFDTDDLPDATLYKPCGTRRESVCPACAEVYRWDAYHLIAAGLRGGKGVPGLRLRAPGDVPDPHPAVLRRCPHSAGPHRSTGTGHRGSAPAGPAGTVPPARTADRCPAGSCTATAIPAPARRSAWTATTTPRRSPGTRSSPSSGPAPSTRSNGSCAACPERTAAPQPDSATPRSRSSKPAAPSTCTRCSASTATTPPTRPPSSPPPPWATAELLNRLAGRRRPHYRDPHPRAP